MKPNNNRRTLSLQRTTVRSLTESEMSGVDGGTIVSRPTIIITRPPTITITTTRPSAVDACPSALICPTTFTGTSVINPGNGL